MLIDQSRRWHLLRRLACCMVFVLGAVAFTGPLRAEVFDQVQMLPGGLAGRHQGWAVAVEGDWALVGVPRMGSGEPGLVEVYQRSPAGQWLWFTRLTASDGTANDRFGAAIAMDGDTIVIGAPGATADGWMGAGRAYVFQRRYIFPVPPNIPGGHVFLERRQLERPATGTNFWFGSAVAVAGDVAVASTPYADVLVGANTRDSAGTVAVYHRHAGGNEIWGRTALLLGANHVSGLFGYGVATDGARLMVGAPGENLGNPVVGILLRAGRAYFYDLDSGGVPTYRQYVQGSTAATGRSFGAAVAISGNYAAVGAPMHVGDLAGSVDILEFTGSAFQFMHRRESPFSPVASFGVTLAMEGSRLVVGAPGEAYLTYTKTGRAYVYDRSSGGDGGWGQVQGLFPDTGGIFDYDWLTAGSAVALDESTILVGAPSATYGFNQGAGTAFVFSADKIFGNGFQCPIGQICVISP